MKILVVDDEKNIRESISKFLKLEGMDVSTAENGLSAKRLLEEEYFHAAVIDLKMPGMDGLELLQWIKNEGPRIPVIMISAFGEINDAVNAMKLGARDYIVKPFDPEELTIKIKTLIEEKIVHDKIESQEETPSLDLIGTSPKMLEIKKLISKVAKTKTTILITGESGTGKEVIARSIHSISPGDKFPFVAINVGGIPENLLESELFGYEKGAFTGANARKPGMFELASNGTLFLDEIGDMPIQLQVKLLRVLQEKKIQRLGGINPIPIDVRIIAATNKNLEKLVKEEKFREDLYFRLNVINISIPPLRERREDIPHLINHFIKKYNKNLGKQIKEMESEAIEALKSYDFPGNVRELENIIERAFILSEGEIITIEDLGIPVEQIKSKSSISPKAYSTTKKLKDLEREAIIKTLLKWEGNRTKAAEELGITRRTLLNKIKEYNLEKSI